jgi:benzoyl-CoA reductase/2-hydroxyglutaryl-CoA dehydratase subunit BcrC/BadD/HgdB
MSVFCTSPWIPPEWISAYGHEPRGVWTVSRPRASASCSEGICAFANGCLEAAAARVEDDLFVFDSGCDQMRRAFDALAGHRQNAFLFNLPATGQSLAPRRIYRSELERLGRWLAERGGSVPDTPRLLQVIRQHRDARLQLAAAMEGYSARQCVQAVAHYYAHGAVWVPGNFAPAPANSVPLALLGGHLPAGGGDPLDHMERCGGRIVLNATAAGERALGSEDEAEPAIGSAEDAVEFLTRRYLENSIDIFHRPNSRFYQWLGPRLHARRVRGIVLWTQVNCDLWRAEAQAVREAFGRPVCLIEEEAAEGLSPRDAGRIEAFLELLR